MNELASPSAADAARRLSTATGERYELAGRLAGGETGAHEFVAPDQRRVVVKWDIEPASQPERLRAVGLTDRLRRDAGWPVPRTSTVEHDGCLFVIQDLMPGLPIEQLTHAIVDQLLELHASRIGRELPADASTWPRRMVETLTTGGAGYCRHETLRGRDARSVRLVERVEAIGPGSLAGGDIVHWDFHAGNLLEVNGHLSAVIDNDFVTTGDAAFDLTALAVSSLATNCEAGVRHRLLELGVRGLSEPQRAAYVGHLLLRNVDWSIRKGREAVVEFWLDAADRLFGE